MTVEVTVKTVEPTPTAVIVAATTWAGFPKMWGPMLDKVWSFLRGDAPEGLYKQGHNIMLYKDDVPNVEVGVQVTGSFDPAGHVVASTLPGGLVAIATHTVCRARTRTMALSWYFLSSSGRSPILVDQAVDDLPARDPAGHVDRLAAFM